MTEPKALSKDELAELKMLVVNVAKGGNYSRGLLKLMSRAISTIDAQAAELAALQKLDQEAGTYVEAEICLRTHFTGQPPYVGWKGLGLAMGEVFDECERLRAELAALNKAGLLRSPSPSTPAPPDVNPFSDAGSGRTYPKIDADQAQAQANWNDYHADKAAEFAPTPTAQEMEKARDPVQAVGHILAEEFGASVGEVNTALERIEPFLSTSRTPAVGDIAQAVTLVEKHIWEGGFRQSALVQDIAQLIDAVRLEERERCAGIAGGFMQRAQTAEWKYRNEGDEKSARFHVPYGVQASNIAAAIRSTGPTQQDER